MSHTPALKAQHVLLEVTGELALQSGEVLLRLMREAATATGATILFDHIHPFGEGHGFTGALILAESHMTVHTWPEHRFAAFDIFVCGDCDPSAGVDALKRHFSEDTYTVKLIQRGIN